MQSKSRMGAPATLALATLFFWIGLFAPGAVRAQDAAVAPAEPGSELSVYLVTMGQGDLVWEKFGHNALWIEDRARGTSTAYNYGIFDFHQENFLLRFIQGRMLYMMAGWDAEQMAAQYIGTDRSVWVQELNLTSRQRLELQQFLEWNERPENRDYRYDYYHDNCSTRVRDALDRVLDGQLQAQTGDPSGSTYRSHTRRLTAGDPLYYTGLEIGLGPQVDRPISLWEEMFLPLRMRETLREAKVRNAEGELVPLVANEWTVYESTRAPVRDEPPFWIPAYLIAGALLGGLFALLGRSAPASRIARWGLAVLGATWSLMIGVGGVVLAGLWALTDHAVAYRNENLFHIDPLALGLVVLVPALAFGARWAARPARVLAVAVAALSVLGAVLQLLPGLDQVNGEIVALALPAHLGLAWAVHHLARRVGTAAAAAPPAPAPELRSVPAR